MSSQDTLNSAMNEEQKADILQGEMAKEQAAVQAMQHDMASEDQLDSNALQRDVDSKNQIISSLQQNIDMHKQQAQTLRQQAADEQQREQQEQERQQQEDKDGLLKKGAKEVIDLGLFK